MSLTKPRQVRCAIYTRKSTEEGLEQSFNTLDAQREACEAYIISQAGEGWTALPQSYDDGGYSGGNLDRPAIQQLLEEVDRGKVDVIVVYKVDRLTRSLSDFARIVERLDASGASFVSVTQAFNTTTSMGRLTLNVLLSFAQFEREVTGERIRDKIAASKAKGMWMGGSVPLGYDLKDRHLHINDVEAKQVRHMFASYAELRSGVEVVRELRRDGILTKCWTARSGQERGGLPFSCGALYYILQNRLYVGEIVHGGKSHRGEHDAIIDRQLFDEVQKLIAANRWRRRSRATRTSECRLAGLVHHGSRGPMTTSFSYGRAGRLYRYYVAGSLNPSRPGGSPPPLRVPAAPLEKLVLDSLIRLSGNSLDWNEVPSLLRRVEIWDRSIQVALRVEAFLEPHEAHDVLISRLQGRVGEHRVVISEKGDLRMIADRSPRFRGGVRSGQEARSAGAQSLRMRLLVRAAHELLERCNMSPLRPDAHLSAIAPTDQRHRRLMSYGLLAPSLQKRMLGHRTDDSVELLKGAPPPLAWSDQMQLLNEGAGRR